MVLIFAGCGGRDVIEEMDEPTPLAEAPAVSEADQTEQGVEAPLPRGKQIELAATVESERT